MKIRPARMGDAAGIARVHVDSWRTTYAGIMPDEVLAGLSYERRQRGCENKLQNATLRDCHFVAVDHAGAIVGFADGGPVRGDYPDFTSELYAIYLLKEAQGAGTGRALFQAVTDFLKAQGHKSMLLWVAEENHPSRRFYVRMGGVPVHRKEDAIGGKPLVELGYGYDLTNL